ncbi:hypothetical protein TVAG_182330 [Trichomonas vaginalis G3]|uniref:DUF3447 domain-containing protein n=1 Tax=Trichomonas vaginalis (strain ATCC PRA-98 / G3) TaxID=412133 RepID=A2D8X1_TRIV3|nr:spectrin binding [Trichomonas vaginalis G3]EAY22997.1 hypothetical protein TVAG_182330 [Trichomonas vaginalis G3]KAI5518959.1 spectrin binding [Trichomonas vaginalis G3]|eukprot:XP_001583983.1 hypothetical protein [Trichomonas vaginalis G3]
MKGANIDFNQLMELCKDSRDSLKALYQLNTHDENDINKIYTNLKEQIDSPEKLVEQIILASKYNLRFFKSYWTIFKKVFGEFHPKRVQNISPIFDYMVFKEYGIVFQENSRNSFEKFENKNYTLDIHEKFSIYTAIMEDNLEQFVSLASKDDFDENVTLQHDFYPKKNHEYSLLELCCYYGAVKCFKFIITKFEPEITPECLQLSFLSGKPDIMNECMKVQKPDNKCMKYAIISHNIDFVTFLMREHKIDINLDQCCKFNCIEAFCAYLVNTKDYITCFVHSPKLFSVPLLEYFINHVDNIDIKSKGNYTALYIAVLSDFRNGVKLLVSKGASINEKFEKGNTYLHYASWLGFNEIVNMFISYGIDVNSKGENGSAPLHFTALYNLPDTAEILLQHGADINIGDENGETPIHYSVQKKNKEICEFLLQNNADVNRGNNKGQTALHKTAEMADTKFAELLLSHGADINARDNNGETPLSIAIDKSNLIPIPWGLVRPKSDEKETPHPDYSEYVEYLLSHGVDVNIASKRGITCLHRQAASNNKKKT